MTTTSYKFFDKVKNLGKTSKYILIPMKLVRAEGLKDGDLLEVEIRRAADDVVRSAMAQVAREQAALEIIMAAEESG